MQSDGLKLPLDIISRDFSPGIATKTRISAENTVYWGNMPICRSKVSTFGGAATLFFVSKNHAYKNVEAQICLKFKNIVVILLVSTRYLFYKNV